MRFNPMSEEEIKKLGMIDPGSYDFEVVSAIDEISRNSGQEQIKLTLLVFDMQGKEHTIFDYLTGHANMQFKVRHFCEAVGIIDRYEAGDLNASDCLNRCGKLEIAIQKGKPNPNGGVYPDRAGVKDYIPIDENSVEVVTAPGTTRAKSFDDEMADIGM
jgi:hypothetical protein